MRSVENESGAFGALCLLLAQAEALMTTPVNKKGLGTLYAWTRRLLPGMAWCTGEIAPHSFLRIPTLDPYWGPVVVGGRPYEPDVLAALSHLEPRLRGANWAFLDCGANYGYWSVLLSGPRFRCPHVVAVEANPTTARFLKENQLRNRQRFQVLQRALAEHSLGRVALSHDDHARHADVRVRAATNGDGVVDTICLDDIVRDYLPADAEPLVIKLDVEGYETQSLAGFRRERGRPHVILYEDHGSDPGSHTTGVFLAEGYAVWHVSVSGEVRQVETASAASEYKTNPVRGYNFVAALPGTEMAELFTTALVV